MPTTARPNGWLYNLLEWKKSIDEKNKERAREAKERELMAQEDILSHKMREANRNGIQDDTTSTQRSNDVA